MMAVLRFARHNFVIKFTPSDPTPALIHGSAGQVYRVLVRVRSVL
jgi:hypothetical protein